MALKRQPRDREGGDGDSHLENKRRHLLSNIFKGASRFRNIEEFVPMLEPIIRNWVKEEIGRAIDPHLSQSLDTQSERRSSLHLQFQSNLPTTLFTGNKITTPIKIGLYDPSRRELVSSCPYSSSKVVVVVLRGDFNSDEWSSKDFESKVVHSREGKRPLLHGEAVVALENGVGYIHDICFTDNSSWDRSGMFRLGVKLHSGSGVDVREGVSSAFKVKDQRGEAYEKHHPPLLSDEVWRLEKIGKGGAYHRQLSKLGISNVGDFLRSHALDPISLRAALSKISKKKWEAITGHAAECVLDDKRYVYTAPRGAALVFNSVYALVGVTFDGLTYPSLDALDTYQKKTVEELKQLAFRNLSSWGSCEANPNIVPQTMAQGEVEKQINKSFEMGERSEIQGFDAGFYDFEEH